LSLFHDYTIIDKHYLPSDYQLFVDDDHRLKLTLFNGFVMNSLGSDGLLLKRCWPILLHGVMQLLLPNHFLYCISGTTSYGPRDKSGPQDHFIRLQRQFVDNKKIIYSRNIFYLVELNISCNNHIM